jgi:hypothetical protein
MELRQLRLWSQFRWLYQWNCKQGTHKVRDLPHRAAVPVTRHCHQYVSLHVCTALTSVVTE